MKRFSENASLGQLVFQPSCKELANVSNVLLDSLLEILLTPLKKWQFPSFPSADGWKFPRLLSGAMAQAKRGTESLTINRWGMEQIRVVKTCASKTGYSSVFQTGSEFGLLRQ